MVRTQHSGGSPTPWRTLEAACTHRCASPHTRAGRPHGAIQHAVKCVHRLTDHECMVTGPADRMPCAGRPYWVKEELHSARSSTHSITRTLRKCGPHSRQSARGMTVSSCTAGTHGAYPDRCLEKSNNNKHVQNITRVATLCPSASDRCITDWN